MIKKTCITLLLLCCTLTEAQNKYIPILDSCVEHQDAESCSYFIIQDLINSKINTIELEKIDKKISEIIISSFLKFDKFGNLDNSKSLVFTNSFDATEMFEGLLNTIPKIKPPLSTRTNKPYETDYRNTFYFRLEDEKFVPWINPNRKESDFYVPSKVPVFRGCKPKWSNDRLRECMSNLISKYVTTSFNKEIVKKSGVLAGTAVKINAFFKIDETGQIFDVGARSSSPVLEAEAIRILKGIQKMEPGYIGGKPTITRFGVPILFRASF